MRTELQPLLDLIRETAKRPNVTLQRRGFGIVGDGKCSVCALTAAMLGVEGEIPLMPPNIDGACEVNAGRVLCWAAERHFSTLKETWAFINGFDGKECDEDCEGHEQIWEAGRKLSIELLGPVY